MSINYRVIVEKYVERHYISNFKRKYKGAWDVTWKALVEEFKRIDTLIGVTNVAEVIADVKDIKICKTEFRVHGTQESRHTSGNRCIVAIRKNSYTVHILLLYNKNDLGDANETAAWKSLIRENYPELKHMLR